MGLLTCKTYGGTLAGQPARAKASAATKGQYVFPVDAEKYVSLESTNLAKKAAPRS